MRDVRGKAVAPDKDERVAARKTGTGEETSGDKQGGKITEFTDMHDKMLKQHDEQIGDHHRRISELEKRAGIAKPPNEMKSEAQGSGKAGSPGKGHDTEGRGAMYGRARH
jgi:hypothetical protein